jgi:hypothetical protein
VKASSVAKLLRERVLHAAGNELAAAVTRSHPDSLLAGTAKRTRTDGEQISQTGRQTEETVLMPMSAKLLKDLVADAVERNRSPT